MQHDALIQRPSGVAAAEASLILLFHGVGASQEDLRPLGQFLAAQQPRAWVVSLRAPHASDFGSGWQWFSVQGVTEANRPARVAQALPAFRQAVDAWQAHTGVSAANTTLVGFSQGAIMALSVTQEPQPAPAGRVVAIAGRFPHAPVQAARGTCIHLLHGEQDRVMPASLSATAAQQLRALGADCTLALFPGLGHGIDGRVAQAVAQHLAAPCMSSEKLIL